MENQNSKDLKDKKAKLRFDGTKFNNDNFKSYKKSSAPKIEIGHPGKKGKLNEDLEFFLNESFGVSDESDVNEGAVKDPKVKVILDALSSSTFENWYADEFIPFIEGVEDAKSIEEIEQDIKHIFNL